MSLIGWEPAYTTLHPSADPSEHHFSERKHPEDYLLAMSPPPLYKKIDRTYTVAATFIDRSGPNFTFFEQRPSDVIGF